MAIFTFLQLMATLRYAMADDDLDNIRNTDEYKAVIDADN
jgi:hypothetical protein